MNRKAKIEFINDKVLPGAEIEDWYWKAYGREIVAEMVKALTAWRIGKPADVEMDGEVKDGVFFINGEAVKRVAPRLPRTSFEAEAYYYEGRILAKQEVA